jgi:hypothetical protein
VIPTADLGEEMPHLLSSPADAKTEGGWELRVHTVDHRSYP